MAAPRHVLVAKDEMRKYLGMHVWLGQKEHAHRTAAMLDEVFADHPDRVFPFGFQLATERALMAPGPGALTLPEARFIYDSAYRMMHEILLGRCIGMREPTCFDDDGEPIPLAKKKGFYKKPDGYCD